jgi:hypothetical protein
VAVDPVYAWPARDLVDRVRADVDRASRYSIEHPDSFVWTWFPTTAAHLRERTRACETFVADRDHDRLGAYCAGTMPNLPFPDRAFRLVVSSHLLFVYADRLDLAFHVEAALELARVSRGEVRFFPLVDPAAVRYPHLEELRAALAGHGVDSELRRVAYETVRGGDELLACRRAAGPV